MSTLVIETPVKVSNPTLNEGALTFEDQIISDKPAGVPDHRRRRDDLEYDNSLEQLTNKKQYRESLEGNDAALYLRMSSGPAPTEKPIEIPSLLSKLSSLLPRSRQLERRVRKLAWQLSKGKRLDCDWDYIFLSELTPAEQKLSEGDFLNLYPDHVERPTKRGGRPRKHRTAVAKRKAHAERQRRYRERKLLPVSEVTKTPSQLVER